MTHFELVKHLEGPAHGWLPGEPDLADPVTLWHEHLGEHLADHERAKENE